MTLELQPLVGSNPLAFFAALGALAAVDRQAPELKARLWWSKGIVPRACIDGPSTLEELIDIIDRDRQDWSTSLILNSGPDGTAMDDVKPSEVQIRQWAQRIREKTTPHSFRDAYHFQALLAEFALAKDKKETNTKEEEVEEEPQIDGKKKNTKIQVAKPSRLHFTAGQQQFIAMVRRLNDEVDSAALKEAIAGPWLYESKLPVLGWDIKGERIYALRGTNPSGDKKTGIPGADWLAFVGLSFFPSAKYDGWGHDQLLTTGCSGSWKKGTFHWPLWSVPLSRPVISSLLAFEGLLKESIDQRVKRGVFQVLEAPIRRLDQGGSGSFDPAGSIMVPIGQERN